MAIVLGMDLGELGISIIIYGGNVNFYLKTLKSRHKDNRRNEGRGF